MKYFLDTEFLEGPQRKRIFGIPTLDLRWDKNNCLEIFNPYTPNTIDLISIGIVSEDGREYYAISKDFNLKEAWNRYDLEIQSGDMRNVFPEGKKIYWIRENVLKPIYYELIGKDIEFHDYDRFFTLKEFKSLINKKGKTNKEIASEIRNFIYLENKDKGGQIILGNFLPNEYPKPEFYAYYADYDWVVFCWLFGKMINLPKGFPMYCKDLKQIFDEKANSFLGTDLFTFDFKNTCEKSKSNNIEDYISAIKNKPNFPIQDKLKSHNAIEDARWNKKLYEFLNSL